MKRENNLPLLKRLNLAILPESLLTEASRLEYTTRAVFAVIGLSLLLSTVAVIILDVTAQNPAIWPIFLMLGLMAIHAVAWVLILRGYWKVARYFPPAIFLIAGGIVTTQPDLHTIAILQYILCILLTAILFNTWAQWVSIAVCAAVYLIVESTSVELTSNYIADSVKYVNVVIFMAVGVLQQITSGIISLTIRQLTEETEIRKRSEESALQKEGILSAIAESAQMMVGAVAWEAKMPDVLEKLGTASKASHAYLFKNHRDENGRLLTSLMHEWSNPIQSCPSQPEEFQNIPVLEEDMADWYNVLVSGSVYYDSTDTFPETWAKLEGRSDIRTLLDAPIFVDGEWWGVIGFDDCERIKPWSQAEVDALQAAAGLIGSVIKRQNSMDALSASENKFNKAFHETLVPMVIGRISDRIILDANKAFAKLTGYAREEIINRWSAELNLWNNREENELHRRLIREHGFIHEFKTTLRKRDGQIGTVLISVSIIQVNQENCLLYTISEITTLERALNDLQNKNTELERFTYTVSHDLKAPLITIGGFMGLLQKDLQSGNMEKVKQSATRILDAVSKMERLLNELLELSRIGRIINEPVKVPFEEIVREAVSLVQGRLSAQQVQVRVEAGLPTVQVDRARMVEVIQNLLDNSAKFMGNQPAPEINVGMRRSMDGERIFYVSDNGIGIEPVYHERVFGLFNKLDANTEGTGIGLALVRRIVELHGGRIWVESEGKGKGAAFCFTLGT